MDTPCQEKEKIGFHSRVFPHRQSHSSTAVPEFTLTLCLTAAGHFLVGDAIVGRSSAAGATYHHQQCFLTDFVVEGDMLHQQGL